MSPPVMKIQHLIGSLCLAGTFLLACFLPPAISSPPSPYQALPGLIDIRTSFSDSVHSMEEIVTMARSRGFKVIFFNDHDRVALSYGLPPFRRVLRYKEELPSIMTHGPEQYLAEISRLSMQYPDMILVPGCIVSPFYYWTGSWLKGDLTVHQYDRKILILDFDRPDQYRSIPAIGNDLSLRYTPRLFPRFLLFLIPFLIGLLLLFWRGAGRKTGLIIAVVSAIAMVDYNPFRSSIYTPYHGSQGIAPFQEVIDYVREQGKFCFWNYPEQRSGVRKHGPIFLNTPPFPEVLEQSFDYTGFAAIYGDVITVTDPGHEWDRTLNEYCSGVRLSPPWGISTADFHEDGKWGLKLGAYPTTFLVEEISKKGILEAMEKGRMYSSKGDGRVWPLIDYFTVSSEEGKSAFMGETLTTSSPPVIRFRVSMNSGQQKPVTLLLIRGGALVKTFDVQTPIEVEYTDPEAPKGEMTFYRLIDRNKHLTSNPIFVKYTEKP
jgi:hypothetical protein